MTEAVEVEEECALRVVGGYAGTEVVFAAAGYRPRTENYFDLSAGGNWVVMRRAGLRRARLEVYECLALLSFGVLRMVQTVVYKSLGEDLDRYSAYAVGFGL